MNQARKFSRRLFLGFVFVVLFASIGWILYRKQNTAKLMVAFFGFGDNLEPLIGQSLETLKKHQKHGFEETALFFRLDRIGISFLLSRELQDRVLEYWCKQLFLRRSIAWPYVHYPAYGDQMLCDGLIRT